jgi:beta-lactamase regulating signal transducer with metallopeptidase domain
MNELSLTSFMQAGLWCVIQVTLLALVALMVLWPLGWLKRPIGSGPAFSAIVMAGLLTLLSFAPLPQWWSALSQPTKKVAFVSLEAKPEPTSDRSSETISQSVAPQGELSSKPKVDSAIDWSAVWSTALENAQLDKQPAQTFWSWRNAGLLFACASIGLGIFSLIASLVGLLRLRIRSKAIDSGELREHLDILQAQASCTRRIDIRESTLVGGPATFGHYRPVILLPPAWRTWTEAQLLAVLAHEVAHIQRGDYLSHLASQMCLAVHFYHPLMHALVGRLRLDQELAADALASQWSGPRESYLRALAEVALSLPPRGSGLAVRSFVPSRGAWVRRIEMLKSMRGEGGAWRGSAYLWLGVMGIVALGVSSVRGPRGEVAAQEPGASKAAPSSAAAGEYITKYVPQNAEVVIAVRPGEVFAHPIAKVFLEARDMDQGPLAMAKKAGIDVAKFEQIVASGNLTTMSGPGPGLKGVFVARYAEAGKIQTLLPKDKPAGVVDAVALFETPEPGLVWGEIDGNTVIIGSTVEVAKVLSASRESGLVSRKAWEKVKGAPFAIIVKSEAIRSFMRHQDPAGVRTPQGALREQLAGLDLGTPIWEDTDALALQLTMKDDLKAAFHTESPTEEQAKEVSGTVSALATLGRNWLRSQLEMSRPLEPAQIVLVELARDTLMNVKVANEGSSTQATLLLADKGKIAAMLPFLLTSARTEAAKATSMNNMKQIAIALHNYHDTYGHMPPAILYGPDGKTPYSWRVAILPYIEQDVLYRQYKFDEPWDSENNKKVLAKVPAVFQDPSEKGKSTNASYFAVAGVNTMLCLGAKGAGMAQITDGTSNTIMVVDAKKDIPWTKPEDITLDTPAAMLGYQKDSFMAGMGDGSVRMIKKEIDPTMLKWLFIRDDGNVVTIP